jgi:Tol biopolymer transport system component
MKFKKLAKAVLLFFAFVSYTAAAERYVTSSGSDSSKDIRVKCETLLQDGGHLAWSKANNMIAFDRLGDDGWFDLWIMNADGTNQTCLTANHPVLPDKHIGQPAWHPSGKFMVIQVMKPHVPDYAENKCRPGAGALNDLWIITEDGKSCWKIHAVRDEVSKDSAGVLHPHFSHDGKKLFWSERIKYNSRPFGEWILRIADFSFTERKGPVLGKIRDYNPGNRSSFFESHSFSPDDRYVLFTGNQDGPLEIYEMEVDTGNTSRLTHHSVYTWDEHAHYSPNGNKIIWMSSRDVRFEVDPFYLEAEFWIMNRDGSNKQRLTWFHQPGHPHYLDRDFAVAADFDWNPDGKQIAGLVITHEPDTDKRGSGIVFLIDSF